MKPSMERISFDTDVPVVGHVTHCRSPESSNVALGCAAGTGSSLALVHGLYARHRDGMSFGNEVGTERLRCRHVLRPRIAIAEQSQRRVNGEVAWGDAVEVIPRHGK